MSSYAGMLPAGACPSSESVGVGYSLGRVLGVESGELRAEVAGDVPEPAEPPTAVFRFGGVVHARRQAPGGRVIMGIGFSEKAAMADLEAQWSMA